MKSFKKSGSCFDNWHSMYSQRYKLRKKVIGVTAFTNLSKDTAYDWLCIGIADTISYKLRNVQEYILRDRVNVDKIIGDTAFAIGTYRWKHCRSRQSVRFYHGRGSPFFYGRCRFVGVQIGDTSLSLFGKCLLRKYRIILRAFLLYVPYIVTFPKKYFICGSITVSAPNPSQRLSSANIPFCP